MSQTTSPWGALMGQLGQLARVTAAQLMTRSLASPRGLDHIARSRQGGDPMNLSFPKPPEPAEPRLELPDELPLRAPDSPAAGAAAAGAVRPPVARPVTPDPGAPSAGGGQPFTWEPLPHRYAGTGTTCVARAVDAHGFEGTCAQRIGHSAHRAAMGQPPPDFGAGLLGRHRRAVPEEEAGEAAGQREPGSAVPSDHVRPRQLEDYLLMYGHLSRLEAQRVAHLVCAEYDLFPKGLLLIHKGLDAS